MKAIKYSLALLILISALASSGIAATSPPYNTNLPGAWYHSKNDEDGFGNDGRYQMRTDIWNMLVQPPDSEVSNVGFWPVPLGFDSDYFSVTTANTGGFLRGSIAMKVVCVPGTYDSVTVDATGRVTGGSGTVSRSFNNTATKTLVTSATGQGGVQLDASRDTIVSYSVATSTTATIAGAASVTVFLEIAATNSATAGDWTAIAKQSNGQTLSLAITLQSIQTAIVNLNGVVPAGKYVRLRYATTGTASATYDVGQEVKL